MSVGASSSSIAATRVAGPGDPRHDLIMLHGIYGRGRNWQAIARGLTEARPDYACWLGDLPFHGDSGRSAAGADVQGRAARVTAWLAAQGLTPRVILGHSYGGKVGLAMADHLRAQPLQLWVIDSTPEMKEPSGSAWTMLNIVRALPPR